MKKVSLIFLLLFPLAFFAQQRADIVIFDGQYFNGETFVPFAEMVIDNGRIKHISNKKLAYVGDTVIVAKGKFIIPGLTDAHVHLQGSPGKSGGYVMFSLYSHSAMRAGVTTQWDLFSSKYNDMAKLPGKFPQYFGTVLNAGPCITVPYGHGANMGSPAQITSVADAEKWALKLATDSTINFIKIIYQRHSSKHAMTEDEMKKIVAIAHQHNKKVLAHIDHSADAIECALAGVDALAHIPMNKMRDGEIDTLKNSGIYIIPTYTVYEATYDGMSLAYASDSLLRASAHPDDLKSLFGKPMPPDSKKEYWPFEVDYSYNLKKIIEKGIPILAGTDAGNYAVFYGYSLHNELEQYVYHGMAHAAALNTATTNINFFLPAHKTGKITEGYTADLVILNANPLDDITNTKKIDLVIGNGAILKIWPFK
jgi:imidazolonepropionase-like amidohydrolase